MKECTTHHHACDCREAKFAELEAENARLREGNTYMWKAKYEALEQQLAALREQLKASELMSQHRASTFHQDGE